MCQTRSQSHHRHLHIHTSASAASARLSLRLMTRVNDSRAKFYPQQAQKATYATEVVLTSRSSATVSTPSRIPQRWLAVSSRGFSRRGTNSVPHQRCIDTGNSIWTSRIHQLRRPLLHQVVRTMAPPVGKHQTMFLRAGAQPLSGRTTTIT